MDVFEFVLIKVLLISKSIAYDSGTAGTFFMISCGYKITGGTSLLTVTSPTDMDPRFCSLYCFHDCNSATYSEQHGTCTTFKEKFYDTSVQWVKDQNWCMLYRKEPIQYGEWTLAFRAQSGINISFYNLWETNGYHNDLSLSSDYPIGCYRMDNLETCTRHFRSSVLDNWTNIDKSAATNKGDTLYRMDVLKYQYFSRTPRGPEVLLESPVTEKMSAIVCLQALHGWKDTVSKTVVTIFLKVRVSLFTDGVQAAYMVFNGTSTNRQSWYSQKLVIDSSWTSLKNDNAVANFDFLGAPNPDSNRPMSIFNKYDICATDTMYFMVMDKFNDGCLSTWSLVITKFPAFVYSGLNHMVTLAGQDYKIADVMAIFVSLAT